MQNKPKAFTLSNSGRLGQLITPCQVSAAYNPATLSGQTPIHKPFMGLWDTGASCTMITNRVATALGLVPTGICQSYHAQGVSNVNTYFVNVVLPNGIQVHSLKVSEGNLPGNIDILIGMDIISLGDFSITHKNGGTVFSFQVPSTHEYDFVKQVQNGVGAKHKKKPKKRKR